MQASCACYAFSKCTRIRGAPSHHMPEDPQPRYTLRISEMPSDERPRERLQNYGASSLSHAELIAILLRTGTNRESALDMAGRIMSQFGSLRGLARATFNELIHLDGVGEAKASQILAGLELGRRLRNDPRLDKRPLSNPQDVFDLLGDEMSLLTQEHLKVILLDTKNRVMEVHDVYKGNVNSSQIRASEVFGAAVKANATAIVIAHNHPSGNPTPSAQDAHVTADLVKAGELLGIDVLDHIIIGHPAEKAFVSLKEQGIGFG